jgi:hypothetical protein
VSATKDILAAITFLVTGILFLIAQAGRSTDPLPAQNVDGERAETVVVTDGLHEVPDDSARRPPVTWDS